MHICNQFLLYISNWLEPILRVGISFLHFSAFFHLFVLWRKREGVFAFVTTSKMRYPETFSVRFLWHLYPFDLIVCNAWMYLCSKIQFDRIVYVNVAHWIKWAQELQNSSSIISCWTGQSDNEITMVVDREWYSQRKRITYTLQKHRHQNISISFSNLFMAFLLEKSHFALSISIWMIGREKWRTKCIRRYYL